MILAPGEPLGFARTAAGAGRWGASPHPWTFNPGRWVPWTLPAHGPMKGTCHVPGACRPRTGLRPRQSLPAALHPGQCPTSWTATAGGTRSCPPGSPPSPRAKPPGRSGVHRPRATRARTSATTTPRCVLDILARITPGTVAVWSTGGSVDCAHWGEIMSTAARQRGCAGAGGRRRGPGSGFRERHGLSGLRQVQVLGEFSRAVGTWPDARCRSGSAPRWSIRAISSSATSTGVVVIPGHLTLDVLAAAEDICAREEGMREDLRRGRAGRRRFREIQVPLRPRGAGPRVLGDRWLLGP